jgi:hypothetical protein
MLLRRCDEDVEDAPIDWYLDFLMLIINFTWHTKELNYCLYIFFVQQSVNLIQTGKFKVKFLHLWCFKYIIKLSLLADMNMLWVNYPLWSQFKICLDSKCSESKVLKEMHTNCKRNSSCYISFYVFYTTGQKMTELETCTRCGDGIFFH